MKSSLGSRTFVAATPLSVLLAGLLALASGCRSAHTPTPAPEPMPIAGSEPDPLDVAPDWLAEPLSWEKLRRVEAWRAVDGAGAASLWRNEADLVLHLGRLEFVRREAGDKDPKNDASVAERVKAAREGLAGVVARSDATDAQKRRAEDGMRRAERLLGAQVVKAKQPPVMGVPIIARALWGARRPHLERMEKTQGEYTRITVHHSADPTPIELDGSPKKTYEAVREIQRAHMDGKATHYGDIGYHFLIDPYGRLLEGRDIRYQGAHAYGDNNVQNIGICLIGNFDQEKPTQAALEALEREIETLRSQYGIPRTRVYGHRELRSTDCPGKQLMKWVERYRKS